LHPDPRRAGFQPPLGKHPLQRPRIGQQRLHERAALVRAQVGVNLLGPHRRTFLATAALRQQIAKSPRSHTAPQAASVRLMCLWSCRGGKIDRYPTQTGRRSLSPPPEAESTPSLSVSTPPSCGSMCTSTASTSGSASRSRDLIRPVTRWLSS